MPNWTNDLPERRGTLPSGEPLRRTDPAGPTPAAVAILGVYPALTEQRHFTVSDVRMVLPTAVERLSFEVGSASGAKLDDNYLTPLGLTRDDVFVTDVMPYYLANTTRSKSGRSMADNVRIYEETTGERTGIVPRPAPAKLVSLASEMPGNLDRLRDYFGRCQPRLVLTLGTEAAAFLRGMPFATANRTVDDLLYGPAEHLAFFGCEAKVAHLVHPHLFIKRNEKWSRRHRAWCAETGRRLVAEALRAA